MERRYNKKTFWNFFPFAFFFSKSVIISPFSLLAETKKRQLGKLFTNIPFSSYLRTIACRQELKRPKLKTDLRLSISSHDFSSLTSKIIFSSLQHVLLSLLVKIEMPLGSSSKQLAWIVPEGPVPNISNSAEDSVKHWKLETHL